MPSLGQPNSSNSDMPGAEMYRLHCSYAKHKYSKPFTHAHYGLGVIYIRVCRGCGAFQAWIGTKDTRKKYAHNYKEEGEWTPAYKLAKDPATEPCMEAAVCETLDDELIAMWDDYVKACKQGKYVPPGDK